MHIRRYATALVVGGLAFAGGLAAGPGDAASENGCRGLEEAEEHAADQAQEALHEVQAIIDDSGNDCEDHAAASDAKGENGQRGDEG